MPGGQSVLEIFPAAAVTALFYPGSFLAPGHYFVLRQALLDAGLGVAALHFPGHGLCKRGLWHTFTFEDLLTQCLLAEEYLRQVIPTPIVAVGHSQGAIFALAHAAQSPTLGAVIAISGVLPQLPEAIGVTNFCRWPQRRHQLLAAIGWLSGLCPWLPIPLPTYLSPGRILAGKRRPLYGGRDTGRMTYPLAYLYSLFTAHIPPQLLCPALLLGAVNDALFPPELLARVFQALQAPIKQLSFIPDGGHTAPYNPTMAQYLARTTAAFCSQLGLPLRISVKNPWK